MPQNFDWSQLAQLIPQLLMQLKGNSVGAAGFAEGLAKGRLLKQQEEERTQRMDIQQQQEQRQGEYQHELITDRQRQRELDTQQEERLRIGAARTGAQTALEAAGEAPDVETGERNLQASLAGISDLYGMKPGAFDQTLTQVKPLIAKRTLTEYEKRIDALKKDYPGGLKTLWDSNQSITMGGGRPPVKFRDMVQAVGGMAIDEDGDVTFPTTDVSAGTSMEGQDLTAYARSVGKTVQQLTYQDRMDFRKNRSMADDKPAGADGISPGQSFQMSMRLSTEANKITQPIREMDRQLRMMKAGLAQAKAGNLNAGSQQILVTFQKILDPTSVVRESEYERSPQGQALLKRIEGIPQRITQGGPGVTIGELESFVAAAEAMVQSMRGWGSSKRKQLERLAKEYGLDPALVFEDYEAVQDNNTDVLAQPAGASATTKPTAADLIRKYGRGQ